MFQQTTLLLINYSVKSCILSEASSYGLKGVRILHEQLETFLRAKLSFYTHTVQTTDADLVGDLAQVEGDQGHGHVGPDWLGAETSHPGVQVLEQGGVDVLGADSDVPGDDVDRGQLQQRGH